ncbi:biotin transporter BioY [Pontivivens insulae]|uniref:Biotin transporter n=1 Tax=Pontivivens insulae TaxID=1639689 RepID=A0A2R8ABC3_9RHOB|nr:biotin transporter BioY [Pontivivens insulae]RED11320.1 biotin transport system substrate-specific component [Pontivivens insulae]SPF29507.1 Biotin transporter BioY [Pontivivens insulae]
MTQRTPMAMSLWSNPSLLRDGALIVGGSLLVAIAAQISVPMFPVPMTLQTLAILFVGLSLGAWRGAAALALYLAEGAMGLPVFANGMSTAALFGPTAGFLFGFVMMAFVAGFLSERVFGQKLPGLVLSGLIAAALLYIPGLAWPAIVSGTSGADLWAYWMSPFLVGDAVKVVLAALLVTGGFKLARR